MSKFVIHKSSGQFHFNLQADNNKVVLTSEQYTSHQSAMKGIEAVKTAVKSSGGFEKKTSSNDNCYFVVKAGNGEVVGTSEMYNSNEACTEGMTAVKNAAGSATVDDQSGS